MFRFGKSRIWDTKTKKFVIFRWPFNKLRYIKQKFIGLRDKNNKKIYVGDILLDKLSNFKFEIFWNKEILNWDFRYFDFKKQPVKSIDELRKSFSRGNNIGEFVLKNIEDNSFLKSFCISIEDIPQDCEVIGHINES